MNTNILYYIKYLLYFFPLLVLSTACEKEDTSSEDKLSPPFEVDKGNTVGVVQADYRQDPILFNEYIEVRDVFPNELRLEARNGNRILVVTFDRNSQDTVIGFFGSYHNANGLHNIEPELSDQYLIIDRNNLDSNILKGSFAFKPVQRDTLDRVSREVSLENGIIDITYEGL